MLFDELYGSESLTQVYGMLVEYVSRLPSSGRDCLKNILYDDACHLKKFSENEKRAEKNEFTRFIANVPKHVDNFHFKNHVDPWCHKMCNPKDARSLDGVNTESCEQTFKWVNKFTSVKPMNESRFFMFFTVIFDLHNLYKTGELRSVAHPGSPLRWELLPDQKDYEETLLEISDPEINGSASASNNDDIGDTELTGITDALNSLNIKETVLTCDDCGATYKKPWTLKNHRIKKHGKADIGNQDGESENASAQIKSQQKLFVCKECQEVFFEKNCLVEHKKVHLVCKVCSRSCDSTYALTRHIRSHKL